MKTTTKTVTVVVIIFSLCLLFISSRNSVDHGSTENIGTNLSVIIWPSFPPQTNSYRHLDHLTNLLSQANSLIATNRVIFSQSQTFGRLAANSPFRKLLGIPTNQPAQIRWTLSMDNFWISIRSTKSEQQFGWIKLNQHSGAIEAVYDIEALFTISELEYRLRQVVGTREEALRLFAGRQPEKTPAEQQQATRAIAEALFLPPETELYIRMSAPGGSNMGQGYLRIETPQTNGYPKEIASVFYGVHSSGNILTEILSSFGLMHRHYQYRFGGPRLSSEWTNLNTAGFMLDTNGYPYPKTP